MSAAEEHLAAVAVATGEAQTLANEAGRLFPEIVEEAAAAAASAIDLLQVQIRAMGAQADMSNYTALSTIAPADNHVASTEAAGSGSLNHALAAQEACQLAVNDAGGVCEFLANLAGAVAEARNVAVTSLMSLVPQLDDGVNGAKAVVEKLETAQTKITLAQTPN